MLSHKRLQKRAACAVRHIKICSVLLLAVVAIGCRQQMADQPRFQPLQKSTLFDDNAASRTLVPGTIPRGFLKEDRHLYEGKVGDLFAVDFPMPISKETLERGKERYEIYCSMCHGFTGYGNGMIVQRGFSPPPSFHDEATRKKPVGYYFSVVSNGFGAMGNYSASISVKDRWAIIAYIRALQLSQNSKIEDVPADKRQELDEGKNLEAGGHK